jgi:hypothetical protein
MRLPAADEWTRHFVRGSLLSGSLDMLPQRFLWIALIHYVSNPYWRDLYVLILDKNIHFL